MSFISVATLLGVAFFSAVALRIFHNLYLHPLSKFPGPWYAASFSLSGAIVSLLRAEPQWLLSLTKKYGKGPIRIAPSMLLFPAPSALREIYWNPQCNLKSRLYGTGVPGSSHMFSTLDPQEHKALRKALGGPQWSIGSLKNNWEHQIDDQISLFIEKMTERADAKEPVVLSDKLPEFAADIMTMVTFTKPWGFVRNDNDEHGVLRAWREGLDFNGFVARFRFFREQIMPSPLGVFFSPSISDKSGAGFFISEAYRQISAREKDIAQGHVQEKPDFMEDCLGAHIEGKPLTENEKRAHISLLIQAGADTTGTALGATMRHLIMNPDQKRLAQEEIEAADRNGKLSTLVRYEEVCEHLPFFVACIKESLRLNPPAPSLLPREVTSSKGNNIDGVPIPPGTDITSNPYVVQRDPTMYAPDPETFRPSRWLESKEKSNQMDNASFVFGMGPRVCLGKNIAIIELYKLLPEIVRRFEFDLIDAGRFVVAGGVAYNQNLLVQLRRKVVKS